MNRLRLGFKHHRLLGLYRPQLPQLPRVWRSLGPLSSSSSPGHDEPLCSRRSGPLHPLQDTLYRDPLIVFPPASPAKKRWWWWWGEGGGLRSAITDPVTFTVVLYQLSPSVSCWWSRAFYSQCVCPLLCLNVTHTHTHTATGSLLSEGPRYKDLASFNSLISYFLYFTCLLENIHML